MGNSVGKRLEYVLKELHLGAVGASYEEVAQMAASESLSYQDYLLRLLEMECDERNANRTTRRLRESRLPLEKSLESFDMNRLPRKLNMAVKTLLDGSFVDRRENVLAFGNPGSGKTHLLCGICQELIRSGRRVLYVSTSLVVQELLAAKRDLLLVRALRKFSGYDVLMLDDLGYVQQSRDEMEVLFTLLSERYERGSVMITSNLPFGKWESIFKDPMTTAAAIDRLVHHSIILELNLPSYRMEAAKRNKQSSDEDSGQANQAAGCLV